MTKIPQLTESMENYLKTILNLSKEGGVARVRDISRTLGVKTSSAANAVRGLMRHGLVRHETYGYVELTADGQSIAKDVCRRLDTLHRFLSEILQVNDSIARKDACGMEHSLSKQTLERLVKFIEFMENGSQGGKTQCLHRLQEYYIKGALKRCDRCRQGGK